MYKTYQGSCHCGKIAFEVEGELTAATDCNCSICQRKGTLMWFVPRTQLRLVLHFAHLERAGLVDATTGTALVT